MEGWERFVFACRLVGIPINGEQPTRLKGVTFEVNINTKDSIKLIYNKPNQPGYMEFLVRWDTQGPPEEGDYFNSAEGLALRALMGGYITPRPTDKKLAQALQLLRALGLSDKEIAGLARDKNPDKPWVSPEEIASL